MTHAGMATLTAASDPAQSTTHSPWSSCCAPTLLELRCAGRAWAAFQALHAGARDPAVCAVVAICPAPEDGLLRFLRSGQALEFECDADACKPWLESLDLSEAAASLGPETALLLMHARGDEQVPYTISEQLYAVAREPKRLLLLPGGHHRSIQHDLELQAVSRKFIRDAAQRSPQPPAT